MLTFRNGAPGGVAQVEAYVAHLMELTLPADQLRLADYYARLDGTEAALLAGMGSVPRPDRGMAPEVAEVLGIDPTRPLTREELGNILGGLRADGEVLEGSQRTVRTYSPAEGEDGAPGEPGKTRHRSAWMDLCLSAPKHLSVAWFKAETEAERQALLQAHRNAVDKWLAYVESEIAVATFGHGREGTEEERGRLGFIRVDHLTARPTIAITRPDPTTGAVATELYSIMAAGDPQIHTHIITPNVMVTESGRVMSIDTTRIAGRVHEFGATYQALLGAELQEIGVDSGLDPRTKMLRLTAIPEYVVDEFSKRTNTGEDAAAAYARREGLDWGNMPTDQRVAMLKAALKVGRQGKGDDLANVTEWHRQAEAIGWRHRSVVGYGPPAPERTEEQRTRDAGLAGLPELEDMLHKSAVIKGTDVRLAAARGGIETGIKEAADIGRITKAMVRNGVVQDGRWTQLLFHEARYRPERVRVTTALHRDQEQELIQLAKAAAGDTAGALDERHKAQALRQAEKQLTDEQLPGFERLTAPGMLAAVIGGAGVGKTTMLAPLVAGYTAQGCEVWGTAIAWRQAEELRDAGVNGLRLWALDPLLAKMRDTPEQFGPNSVVVLDELGQVGTRQLLVLLRHRAELSFKLVMVGDDRQCQSIEAGPVVDLAREALGKEAIPEVLTTIRQDSERDREIVKLWRDGKSKEALAMKREDGTVALVSGGRAEMVQAVALQWRTLTEANLHDDRYRLTVAAPSNADAHEISRAIRTTRRDMGQSAPTDAMVAAAQDSVGNHYDLPLAAGDRVRLFARTRGRFTDEQGRARSAAIGQNGSILMVEGVDTDPVKGGLMLRTAAGKVAFVGWPALRDKGTGRLALASGEVMTIDTAQGSTADDHIMAMSGGSRTVTLYKAHVAGSRNRRHAYLFTSMAAEMAEVQDRRPINAEKLSDAAMNAAVWDNMARNLSRAPLKESALAMLREMQGRAGEARRIFARGERRQEEAAGGGPAESTVRRRQAQRRMAEGLAPVAQQLRKAIAAQGQALGQLADRQQPNQQEALKAMDKRLAADAKEFGPIVAVGGLGFQEALDRMMAREMHHLREAGTPVRNHLALADRAERALYDAALSAEALDKAEAQREGVLARVDQLARDYAPLVAMGAKTSGEMREDILRLVQPYAWANAAGEVEAQAYVALARETTRFQATRRMAQRRTEAGTSEARAGAAKGTEKGKIGDVNGADTVRPVTDTGQERGPTGTGPARTGPRQGR